MATRPRWFRLLVAVLILVAALGWPIWSLARVAGAQRVTIRVERCDNSGPKATPRCYGSWTLADGSRHEGVTEGGVPSAQPGTEFRGWATDTAATRSLVGWLLVPVILGSVVLIGSGAAVVVVTRLWLRARRAGPAGRSGYQG
jgi:hypothetical protein